MLVEALGMVAATALLVILPGWLLLRALFPDPKSLSAVESVYLTIGGGILLIMSVGIILGFLPHASRGAFQSFATKGMPNVELAMIAVSLGLFWTGARRGAYPRLRARFPRFATPWAASEGADQKP